MITCHHRLDDTEVVDAVGDSRRHPGRRREGEQHVINREPAADADPVLVFEFGQCHLAAAGQTMTTPYHQVDGLTHHGCHRHPRLDNLRRSLVPMGQDNVEVGQQGRRVNVFDVFVAGDHPDPTIAHPVEDTR